MSIFVEWFAGTTWVELLWLTVGFMAQAMFSARFLVQWIASEKVRRSIVPETFWYFSFAGGAMLLAYAIYRRDPVFIMGQAFGLMVYARNIYFIWIERRAGEPGHEN
ncbi:lipid-A-disaccharide synthase N-terminal domain-containing protein [Limimaricola pyoseonensis]|uniref:Uncharacterized N-terminal domain of lipid-A-disaccharide synthase n=1 Tax=Limimaricola pyoseonensis TaxID=521013 RepID=A0A1G7A8V0_9RHOB|nr:lipid-A-disaccharide synthase N-terminal domain-containing protein [Limimaricola pyoseonensis]SDE11201.1 Uncharacterized N-terminal domain of lipid-A-disaccharide synthase [Limimaricola pyoseonensis]